MQVYLSIKYDDTAFDKFIDSLQSRYKGQLTEMAFYDY